MEAVFVLEVVTARVADASVAERAKPELVVYAAATDCADVVASENGIGYDCDVPVDLHHRFHTYREVGAGHRNRIPSYWRLLRCTSS